MLFIINFCVCFICGDKYNFRWNDCSKVIINQNERKLFFNDMWAHKPHTKTNERGNRNSNIYMGL